MTTTLAERERCVLQLFADGLSTREVARQMCYSERTISERAAGLSTIRLNVLNRLPTLSHTPSRHGWI